MTPAEIAEASSCFGCLPDKMSALLYILSQTADVTVDEIAENSACFSCIIDKESALLYLLTLIAAGSGGGTIQVYTGASPPAAPDDPTKPALYYPTGGGSLLQWDGAAWI